MIYCHKNLIIIIRCIVCTCQTTRLNIKSFQTFPGNKIQTTSVSNSWINLIVAFMFVTSVFYSYSWLEWKTHMYIKMSILSLPPLKKPHTICILLNIIYFPIADFQKKKKFKKSLVMQDCTVKHLPNQDMC